MRKSYLMLCLLLLIAMLSACTSDINKNTVQTPVPGIASPVDDKLSSSKNELEKPTGKVTVWSYYEGTEWVQPLISAEYPNLDVEMVTLPFDGFADNYIKAVDEGNAPDVLFFENIMLRDLVGMDLFEDVSASPYNGETIAEQFSDATLTPYRSLTNNTLFGLPLDISPAVAYYRSDLFEKAGLPSDPETLSTYMKDSSNWMEAAQKLKSRGSWIAFDHWDPIWMSQYTSSYFNHNLEFARNTPAFATAIDLARSVHKNGLSSKLNLFSEAGRESLNNGETAMFFNGWWYSKELQTTAPDTAGQWRIMRLPLGLYGSTGSSGTAISVSSDNKSGAWAVVSMLAKNRLNLLNEKHNDQGDAFFGGQNTQDLYKDLLQSIPPITYTPLDDKVEQIWLQFLGGALEDDRDPEVVLDNIQQLSMDSVRTEFNIIKEAQNNSTSK